MKIDQTDFEVPRFQALQQHPFFGAALAGMGQPLAVVTLPGHGTAQVLSRRMRPFRKPLKLVSRGPYWPELPSAALQYEAITTLRDQGVRVINAEDTSPQIMRAAGFRQIMTPASIGVLQLGHGPDVRRNLMSMKWRNALRKAETQNLRIEVRPYHHGIDKWVLDENEKQQMAKGFRALPSEVTQAFAIMNKGEVMIVTAARHAVPIAAMIFLRHGSVATYHVGWSSLEGRARNAHNLCLACAADQLEQDGVKLLDMGAIDTCSAPGLARFKIGVGAQVKQLGGTWLHLRCFRRGPAP